MKGFKKIMPTLLGIAMTGSFTLAHAFPSVPSGWYGEINFGQSKVSNVSYATNSDISSSGLGTNINIGYKFIPYFAGEIGYTKYANSTAKVNGTRVAKDVHYSYDAAVKAILPIADSGVDLFAKLGVVRLQSKVSEENSGFVVANGIVVNTGSHAATGYYYGLGAAYTFWQSVAVNGQWQRATGNSKTGNYDLYSLGLGWTFG